MNTLSIISGIWGMLFRSAKRYISIIEIEMDKSRELKELRIIANDAYAGAGIYAISYIDG